MNDEIIYWTLEDVANCMKVLGESVSKDPDCQLVFHRTSPWEGYFTVNGQPLFAPISLSDIRFEWELKQQMSLIASAAKDVALELSGKKS